MTLWPTILHAYRIARLWASWSPPPVFTPLPRPHETGILTPDHQPTIPSHMTLNNTDQVLLSAFAYDASDAPAPLPGPVAWLSNDTSLLTLDPLEGDTTLARSVDGVTGTAQVSATSGNLTAFLDVEVLSGAIVAVRIAIVPGTPEPKTAPGLRSRAVPPSRPAPGARGPVPLRR